jgi:hypothetical protein
MSCVHSTIVRLPSDFVFSCFNFLSFHSSIVTRITTENENKKTEFDNDEETFLLVLVRRKNQPTRTPIETRGERKKARRRKRELKLPNETRRFFVRHGNCRSASYSGPIDQRHVSHRVQRRVDLVESTDTNCNDTNETTFSMGELVKQCNTY